MTNETSEFKPKLEKDSDQEIVESNRRPEELKQKIRHAAATGTVLFSLLSPAVANAEQNPAQTPPEPTPVTNPDPGFGDQFANPAEGFTGQEPTQRITPEPSSNGESSIPVPGERISPQRVATIQAGIESGKYPQDRRNRDELLIEAQQTPTPTATSTESQEEPKRGILNRIFGLGNR